MITGSTIRHLRINFSIFLLPVFLFAFSLQPISNLKDTLIVLFSLHLFLYPASNGYNSYFDKDEGSIGGLKNPPPVKRDLYYVSLGFDVIAVLLAFWVSAIFAAMVFAYGLVSKAYSHPSIRLKKYPVGGLITLALFQGAFTFFMVIIGLHGTAALNEMHLWGSLISAFLIAGFYPMTQIYQHEEDSRRGDRTISIMLGIQGTFLFCGACFLAASVFLAYFYFRFFLPIHFLMFLLFLSPVVAFFTLWFMRSRKDPENANFDNTMRLNIISSTSISLFFIIFWLINFHF